MLRLIRTLAWRRGPLPHPSIVVSGMPKSGTTAIAMLLGTAAGLDVNSDPFHRLDRAGVKFRDDLYAGRLSMRRLVHNYRRFFQGGLVKDPNFVYLPETLDAFAGAGFVFTVRDPRHNIRSLLDRLKLPGRVADAPAAPSGISDTWRRVLDGRTPDVPGDNYIERLAHRWSLAVASYLRHEARMQVIRYEDFMQDKTSAIEVTLSHLDVRGGRDIAHLLDREFQPKGQRGTKPEEFFGAAELQSIERICASGMERLGYAALRSA